MAVEPRFHRFHSLVDRQDEIRHPAERDRDRVLYSDELRRLGSVTQVVSPTERQIVHTRLTHSIEVAQISRGIANRLVELYGKVRLDAAGGLDPFAVEAAALAHDLGHPPFGHVAESELDRLLVSNQVMDGFEGNAQSFRIVTRLSIRDKAPGLNLTRATLAGMLKYPWLRHPSGFESRKWGAYTSERNELEWARTASPEHGHTKSLEAAIMDWADDIAYSVHDIEDFYKAGLIPLDRIFADRELQNAFIESEIKRPRQGNTDAGALERAFDELRPLVPTMYDGSSLHRAQLKQFSSQLVSRYIAAVTFIPGEIGERSIAVDSSIRNQVALLKGLNWQFVIGTQSLSAQRYGQRTLIRSLFMTLAEAAEDDRNWDIFPALTKERLGRSQSTQERLRIVTDSIASMTESQVVDVHRRLTGIGLGSALDQALL